MRSSSSLVLLRSSDSINVEYGMVYTWGRRGNRKGRGRGREGREETKKEVEGMRGGGGANRSNELYH